MASLLSPYLLGPGQSMAAPQGLSALLGNMGQSDRAMRLKDILAPEIALPVAGAMFMGETPQQSFGGALHMAGLGFGQKRQEREEATKRNKTAELLRKSNPELLPWLEAGAISPADAFNAVRASGKTDLTDDLKEYQYAIGQGYRGSFTDYMTEMRKAGATNVNIPGQPTIGTVPQGWAATQDPQSGEWSMAPIKGGPEAQKAEQAVAAGESKDEQRRTWNLIVNEEIGRALKIAKDGGWLPTTGLGSDLAAGVGGTAARDLRGLLDTVRANAGFDRLQAMRDASPTGGALGQVSERELAFLQSTIGNLEQSQSKEQLVYNLERLQKIYQNMLEGRRAYDGLLADNGASGGWQDRGGGVKIRRLD